MYRSYIVRKYHYFEIHSITKGKEEYSTMGRWVGKNMPTPSSSLLSCLSSSAGILNTFLWDLLRKWKDWGYTWLDRHCATLLNLMRQLQHCIKIEREAVWTRFLWIEGGKSMVKSPRICLSRSQLSLKHREALLIFRWRCRMYRHFFF